MNFSWNNIHIGLGAVGMQLHSASGGDLHRLKPYLWCLLERIGRFGTAWHYFVQRVPIDWLEAASRSLNPRDKELVSRICWIRRRYEPLQAGWSIDAFDGNQVMCSTSSLDYDDDNVLCLDGHRLWPHAGGLCPAAALVDGKWKNVVLADVPRDKCHHVLAVFTIQQGNKIRTFRFFDLFSIAEPTYDARIDSVADVATGWAANKTWHGCPVDLELEIDAVFWRACKADRWRGDVARAGFGNGNNGFSIVTPQPYLPGGSHKIRIATPDGQQLAEGTFAGGRATPAPLWDLSILERPIAIVIPAYNAADDLPVCMERALAHTPKNAYFIIVDDCSPDPAMAEVLANYKNLPNVRIIRNEKNLGFPGSANRGIRAAGKDDVVLLNSDARVTPRWLESMLLAAVSSPRVASVTAMSDRAGAFSAPARGNDNPLPEGCSEEEYARAFRRASLGVLPRVPTGNGFCMYISRGALDAVGAFDVEALPRMYGDENDLSMRMLRAGWIHLIDDRSYVFHENGQTFRTKNVKTRDNNPYLEKLQRDADEAALDSALQEKRADLQRQAMKLINNRYPEYEQLISVFSEGPIEVARWCARVAQKYWKRLNTPRFLFVTAVHEGGTHKSTMDLIAEFDPIAQCFELYSDSRKMRLSRFQAGQMETVWEHTLKVHLDSTKHHSAEYDAVAASWLTALDIDVVHIQHIMFHSLGLVDTAKKLGCIVSYTFHDWYAISPNYNMLDDAGVFLGDNFIGGSGWTANIWPAGQPVGNDAYEHFWRKRFAAVLNKCDVVFTFTDVGKARVLQALPNIAPEKIAVIPLGRTPGEFRHLRASLQPRGKIRMLIAGSQGRAKGRCLVESLAAYAQAHGGEIEFHILGCPNYAPAAGLINHGGYKADELPEKIAAIKPHAAAIFSAWEETWSHLLTELWSCGLAPFVFDLGAPAARIRSSGAGHILPLADVPEVYAALIQLISDQDEQARADAALARWQAIDGVVENTQLMGCRYYAVYRALLRGTMPPAIADLPLTGIVGIGARRICAELNDFRSDSVYIPLAATEASAFVKKHAITRIVLKDHTWIHEAIGRQARDMGIKVIWDDENDIESRALLSHLSTQTASGNGRKDVE